VPSAPIGLRCVEREQRDHQLSLPWRQYSVRTARSREGRPAAAPRGGIKVERRDRSRLSGKIAGGQLRSRSKQVRNNCRGTAAGRATSPGRQRSVPAESVPASCGRHRLHSDVGDPGAVGRRHRVQAWLTRRPTVPHRALCPTPRACTASATAGPGRYVKARACDHGCPRTSGHRRPAPTDAGHGPFAPGSVSGRSSAPRSRHCSRVLLDQGVRPAFNVRYRDDKSYPSLAVTLDENIRGCRSCVGPSARVRFGPTRMHGRSGNS
jgi:hypothetical protein